MELVVRQGTALSFRLKKVHFDGQEPWAHEGPFPETVKVALSQRRSCIVLMLFWKYRPTKSGATGTSITVSRRQGRFMFCTNYFDKKRYPPLLNMSTSLRASNKTPSSTYQYLVRVANRISFLPTSKTATTFDKKVTPNTYGAE